MTGSSRRTFLRTSAAAGAAALLHGPFAAASTRLLAPAEPLSMLILGGTGFLGPAIVEAAKPRGHKITLFNRGKTRPDLFPDLEKLQGDRDPLKGEGLKSLEGRKFDVVFDDCGYYPRMVKASAELLGPNVKHYVYVSSISCYAKNDVVGMDEDAPVAKLADETVETMGPNYQNYGGLKALCEQAADGACAGKATIVRPGYIVGPGDPTDRFTYFPVRASKGGEMLAPGSPADPIQVIDVRDLAEWMVLLAEKRTTGFFNAVGPEKKLSMGEVMDACAKAAANGVQFTWVPTEFLMKAGESGEGNIPIWAPPVGETAGFHTVSNARAVKAGLRFRPIDAITKDTLAWFRTLPAERQAKLKAGLSPEQESKLLADFKATK